MEWSDGGGGSGGVRGRVRGKEELGRGEELRRGEELGREEGEGVKWTHGSWALIVHVRAWVVGVHGLWACMGCGRAWVVGAHGLWVCLGRRCTWVVGALVVGVYQSGVRIGCGWDRCWLWAFVMHGWRVVVPMCMRNPILGD